MYINPEHWKYLDPVFLIASVALGVYVYKSTDIEGHILIASLCFGCAVIFLAFIIARIKGIKT